MAVSNWLPVITVVLIYAARMVELRTRRIVQPGQISQRWTLHWFIFCGTAMLFASLAEHFWRGKPFHWFLYWVGLACSIVSIYLRRQAIRALGEFWSLHNEIRANHRFVRTGPFRMVRHPTYFSMILELLGGAIILQAFYSFAVVMVLLLPALWVRIQGEEMELQRKFGEAYSRYQQQVSALFPIKFTQNDVQKSS